jgi:hypothetical protein
MRPCSGARGPGRPRDPRAHRPGLQQTVPPRSSRWTRPPSSAASIAKGGRAEKSSKRSASVKARRAGGYALRRSKKRLAVAAPWWGSGAALPRRAHYGLDPQSRRQLWDIVHGSNRGPIGAAHHPLHGRGREALRPVAVDHGQVMRWPLRELMPTLGGDHVIDISAAPNPGGPCAHRTSRGSFRPVHESAHRS